MALIGRVVQTSQTDVCVTQGEPGAASGLFGGEVAQRGGAATKARPSCGPSVGQKGLFMRVWPTRRTNCC